MLGGKVEDMPLPSRNNNKELQEGVGTIGNKTGTFKLYGNNNKELQEDSIAPSTVEAEGAGQA